MPHMPSRAKPCQTLPNHANARHPARRDIPTLWGSRRALLQSTWRHALFGAVLGGLEALINDRSADEPPEVPYSSNGHGSLDATVAVSETVHVEVWAPFAPTWATPVAVPAYVSVARSFSGPMTNR